MSSFNGRCLCGAISYQASQEPAVLMKCHCRDCQYISGGEASAIAGVPEDTIKISGKAKTLSRTANSGKKVHRSFCPECGTHIYSKAETAPNVVFVKAGTMDKEASAKLKTAVVLWASNANPFCAIDKDVQTFDTQPS